MSIVFYFAAFVAIAATLLAITRRHAVHALLYLIVSLLGTAVVFFILAAPFIAALEVLIYAGAIMVFFVFVVMMLNQGRNAMEVEWNSLRPRDWIGPSLLAALLAGQVIYAASLTGGTAAPPYAFSPKQIGEVLFGSYWIGVELASLLLTAGLVGAYHLGRPPARKEETPRVAIVDTSRLDLGRDPVRPRPGRPVDEEKPDLHVDVR